MKPGESRAQNALARRNGQVGEGGVAGELYAKREACVVSGNASSDMRALCASCEIDMRI